MSAIGGTLKRVNENKEYDEIYPATKISLVDGYPADVALRISGNTISGTAASFLTENPTLAAGQYGRETDTCYMKVGDGVTAWANLPYIEMPTGTKIGIEIDDGAGGYTPVQEATLSLEVWDETEGDYVETDTEM